MMKREWSLALGLVGSLVACGQAYDLAGTWHIAALDLPGNASQNKDPQGIVIAVNGADSFHTTAGTLSIDAAGNVSGNVGETVAGTATADAQGTVTLALTLPEVQNFTLTVTPTSDLMATVHGAVDYNELLVLAKAPAAAVYSDAVGTWWVMELEVPAALDLQYNSQGKLTNIGNATNFRQSRRPLVINGAGRYDYNSGDEAGNVAMAAGGELVITPDATPENPTNTPLHFHLNALKDVAIATTADSYSCNMVILVKSHEVLPWEAAGNWAMSSLNLPGSLPLTFDSNHRVTNISRLDSFRRMNGSVNITVEGPLAGNLENPFAGYAAGSSNGLLSIYHGEPVPFSAAVNTGGDFFVGVDNGSEDLSMIVGIRSIRPQVVGMLPGPAPQVVWVPGTGRVLQEAATLGDWHNVPGSETTSSYTPNLSTAGTRHFYRLGAP